MIGLNIAVLDTDKAYLEGLQAYLIRKQDIYFHILPYSDAAEYVKSQKAVDALLVTGGLWELVTGKRSGVKEILLHEGWVPKAAEGAISVAKYQSAEQMFKQLAAVFWQHVPDAEGVLYAKPARLIGVYAPCHTDKQLLVTMAMAQILGEQERVLYINLMEHSGFYSMTEMTPGETISDLLYGMIDSDTDFTAGLHSVRSTYGEFDYIPPVLNPEHLAECSKEMYERLFQELRYNSGYDVVVIDFGRIFYGFADILPMLEQLYCICGRSKISQYAVEELETYINLAVEGEGRKLKKLILPETVGMIMEAEIPEQFLYGEIGEYIRGCIYGDTDEQN